MSRKTTDRDLLAERYRQRFSEEPGPGDRQARRMGQEIMNPDGTVVDGARRTARAPRLDELDRRDR